MSDDSVFDNPLSKNTPRPSAVELAILAALLDARACLKDSRDVVSAAACLWFRAAQVSADLDAALKRGGVYVAASYEEAKEVWIAGDTMQARRNHKAGEQRFKLGTNDEDSEIVAWLRDNASAKKDHLTRDGFIDAAKQILRDFSPATYQDIGITWLNDSLDIGNNNARSNALVIAAMRNARAVK